MKLLTIIEVRVGNAGVGGERRPLEYRRDVILDQRLRGAGVQPLVPYPVRNTNSKHDLKKTHSG